MMYHSIDQEANPIEVAPISSSQEKWLVAGLTLLILFVTTLPYIFGYFTAPADKQFMGFAYYVPDHAQYLAWFRGFQEATLIDNRLTPEPNHKIFFNLLWFILGRLALYTGLGYASVYQLLRWFSGGVFLYAAYTCCVLAFTQRWQRLVAFLLIGLGAGLGWVLVVIKYAFRLPDVPWPLNLYVAEANSFLSIMGAPHFSLAAAMIIFTLLLLFQGYRQQKKRYIVAASLVALVLGLQHAYDLILIYGIWGFFTLLAMIRERRVSRFLAVSLLTLGGISWWPALYSVYLTRADPMWKEILAQFALSGTYTPDPLRLLILLGLPFVVAVLSYRGIFDRRIDLTRDGLTPPLQGISDRMPEGEFWLLLRVWFFVNFFLAYIPTDYQIHMLNGWQIPIAILATDSLFGYVLPYLYEFLPKQSRQLWPKQRLAQMVGIGFVILCLPTNLYFLTWRFVEFQRYDYPYFLHTDEIAALNWLNDKTSHQDVVLAAIEVGQFVPALTGNRTFLGHWAQTVDFLKKREQVTRFFAATTTDAERQAILQTFDIAYVVYGPAEHALGSYDPGQSPLFVEVFFSPSTRIYAVNDRKAR